MKRISSQGNIGVVRFPGDVLVAGDGADVASAMYNIQVTRDTSPDNARSESCISINQMNPQQIVAGSKKFINIHTYDFTIATSFSTDGGRQWTDSAPLALLPGWTGISDPTLAWDDSDNVFLVALAFNNPPASSIIGIAVYKSTDGGQTWSDPKLIHTNPADDKQWAAGDANPNSPFRGRVYAAWDGPGGLCFARTLDHGNSWVGTGGSPAGSAIASSSFSPEVNVGTDGVVYIVFRVGNEIKLVKSTDGGNSFQATASPATGTGSFEIVTFPPGNFRVVTVPTACAFGDTVVAAWADNREGKSRIYYAVSTNGGNSWDTPPAGQPLLTSIPIDASMFHFHPQLVFRPDGVLACAFYEFGPKPVTPVPITPKIDTRMAVSFDGGASFSQLITVTDQPWDPAIDAPWAHGNPNLTFIGEYFGFDAGSDSFYPLWTDTRTGIQELWLDILPRPWNGGDLTTVKDIVSVAGHFSTGDQRHLVVVGTAHGKVHEIFWKPLQVGIEGEDDLPVVFNPGSIVSLATLYNSDQQRHVVVVGKTDGRVHEIFWKPETVGIEGHDDLPVTFSPGTIRAVSGLYDSNQQRHVVIVATTAGKVHEIFWKADTVGVEGHDDLPVTFPPGSIVGVTALYDSDQQRYVVLVATSAGKVHEIFWKSDTVGIEGHDELPISFGSDSIAAISSFYDQEKQRYVIVVGTRDGNIHQVYWKAFTVGIESRRLVTQLTPNSIRSLAGFYSASDQIEHIVVGLVNGGLREFWVRPNM